MTTVLRELESSFGAGNLVVGIFFKYNFDWHFQERALNIGQGGILETRYQAQQAFIWVYFTLDRHKIL
jgi:hypothetical protein